MLTASFDPVFRLTDTASVRLETVALALVLFVALLLAARGASRSRVDGLRLDDLMFMVVGAVPGAIIGGRLGYVLDHLDYYRANPAAMLDPAQGALTLTLAIPLGLLTGTVVGRLLRAPIAGWLDAIALPLLFALATGKLIGVLGGSGQGLPSDGQWATAYTGPGPWGSLAADVPSHPSQVYEAILIGLVVVVMATATRSRLFSRNNGSVLFLALAGWATARFIAASTWRDAVTVGPLRVEQALLVGVLVIALAGLIVVARSTRSKPIQAEPAPPTEPAAAPEPSEQTEATPPTEPATRASSSTSRRTRLEGARGIVSGYRSRGPTFDPGR